jgi:hypothetical protein
MIKKNANFYFIQIRQKIIKKIKLFINKKEMILKEFLRCLFGLIICVGILGNMTNVLILSKRNMWRLFTFKLIFYLSSIDVVILILCGLESILWLQFEINIRIYSTITCKIDMFLAHFFPHARSILTLAILINSKKF